MSNNSIGAEGANAIAGLKALTSLNLWGNKIGAEGAKAIAGLKALTSLDLSVNSIGAEGAKAIAALKGLTWLNLSNNSIGAEGANAIAALKSLTSLGLRDNSIGAEGAQAIAALKELTSLDLSDNSIGAEGAKAIAGLKELTSLDLSDNSIGDEGAKAILEAWADRPDPSRLGYLNLSGNGDLGSLLPAEVIESTDAQAILAAYRRYRQDKGRPLNEAKLLVVGNEAVGKTSLVHYLVDNKPRRRDEPKTTGIAIREKIETKAWALGETGINLNVWDFGGQEVMHGTHKYFLTERSLYLLVLEARREDDRTIYDWLGTIRTRGGESPVIVGINKCEGGRDLRLDEPGLRKEFPSIVGFVRTSCEPGHAAAATIAELRKLVSQTVAGDVRLKHVRDPIPGPWVRVKNALAEMARERRVLPADEFKRLCEQGREGSGQESERITDPDEQRALLRLMHDLGVVVAHGLRRDAPAAMRDVTLLDPNWLTVAIYALLNSPRIRDQRAEFDRQQLAELLDPVEYPPERHEFILDMMQDLDVGLCLELPGTQHQRYLIPEALPAGQPDYGTWPKDSLRFRYEYALLPRGLVPRFIVQAYRNLTETPTTWRTGMVLGTAGCRVLVQAYLDKRRIDISVTGPEGLRRSALNIVLDDLDEVHNRNPEIGPRATVPLIDEPELAESYEHLLKLEELYGLDYRYLPRDAQRQYTVRELLEGVRRERRAPVEYGLDWEPRRAGGMTHRRAEVPDRQTRPAPAGLATEKQIAGAGATRDLVIVGGLICVLIAMLVLAWWVTQSTWAVLAIVAGTVVIFVAVGTLVAATTGILRGTQLERLFMRILGIAEKMIGSAGKDKPVRKRGTRK